MADVRTVVKVVRDTLVTGLGGHLRALYLFGSAARGQYVAGRSDIDLLLVVGPATPLLTVRELYRSLWARHAAALGHGPLVATPQDLALHLILVPSLHSALRDSAFRLHGEPVLEQLSPPPAPDPVEDVAAVASRAITRATALTPSALAPGQAQDLTRLLDRLARRVTGIDPPESMRPLQAMATLHAWLRARARDLPQFEWVGDPPLGQPGLLPGCLAFYQREHHLIAVLERVDEEILSRINWKEVGEAAEDAHARFGLATPWQLRLVASQVWVDSLYFQGFEHEWGADLLGDLRVDRVRLLRQLARGASEQLVEKVPLTYCTVEEVGVSKLIHDTQNLLLNAGLRAELLARFAGRPLDLPKWTPPGREVPQPQRVAAIWERWREVTGYYARLWQQAAL